MPLNYFDDATIANSNSIHDKFYRSLLKNRLEFANFINNFLNINILPDNLIEVNSSFVTEKFENRISDIIYKLKNSNIYFLLEHQSYIDKFINSRILNYSANLIQNIINSSSSKKNIIIPPQVIPILLYTGNRKWYPPPNSTINSHNLNLLHNINLDFYFIDIHNYTTDELLNINSAIGYAIATDKCNSVKEFVYLLEKMAKCDISNINDTNLRMLFKYMCSNFNNDEEIQILFKKIMERNDENMELVGVARVYQDLLIQREKARKASERRGERRGKREGKREGEQFGIRKTTEYVVRKMLENGESIDKIKLYSNCSTRQINKIKKDLAIN